MGVVFCRPTEWLLVGLCEPTLALRHQPMYAIFGQPVADYRGTNCGLSNAGEFFGGSRKFALLNRVEF